MNRKVFWLVLLNLSVFTIFSQESMEESYKKSFRSELKVAQSQLFRKPQDTDLIYKIGLLHFKLCNFKEAQYALIKCQEKQKNNPYYYLDLYQIEISLNNKVKADHYYYKYRSLVNNKNLASKIDQDYLEFSTNELSRPATSNLRSIEFFPYVLGNDRIKFMTIPDFVYNEPTSPLLFKNYLTNETIFCDSTFEKLNRVKQPDKMSEGFLFSVFCLNKKQDRLYITRYDGSRKRLIICVSEKNELMWGPFKMLNFVANNPKVNFMHPMLNEAEDKLIFVSDMEGGFGNMDLWISDISENGEYSNIKNLGENINTIGNECFPTKFDGNSFFFSSDGHHGYGNLDLYKTTLLNTNATKPINLGTSFNSTRDDYALFYSSNKNIGYFTSNRSFSNANQFLDKIYKIYLNISNLEPIKYEIQTINEQSVISDTEVDNISPIGKTELAPNNVKTASSSKSNTEIKQEIDESLKELKSNSIPDKQQIQSKKTDMNDEVSATPPSKIETKFDDKFWAVAFLKSKNGDNSIGYTYVKISNPQNEVVFSNYTTQKGLIGLEVQENISYKIEIPRYKTILTGIVFSRKDNNLYFPIEIDQNSVDVKSTISGSKSNEISKTSVKTTTNKTQAKPKPKSIQESNSSKKANPTKTNTKSNKKRTPQKTGPKNMIENFS